MQGTQSGYHFLTVTLFPYTADNQRVKRSLFFTLALVLVATFSAPAQEVEASLVPVADSVPLMLEGIWQNDNRYVVFDTGYLSSDSKAIPQIVLRTFYKWYDDRTAESLSYAEDVSARDRNDAATRIPETMELTFVPLTDELFTEDYNMNVTQDDGDVLVAEGANSGAWDMVVRFSGHKLGGEDTYHIPIAVIGNKLFLDFAIKTEDSDSLPPSSLLNGVTIQAENLLDGYWRSVGNANGILACPPVTSNELVSYLISPGAIYHIRYWRTDMPYNPEAEAVFTDGNASFSVPKHLSAADKIYTCTVGRRTTIRNIDKSDGFSEPHELNSVLVHKHVLDENGNDTTYTVRTATILVFGEPYLTLTEGTRTMKEIIAENNARKHPAPKPLFPIQGTRHSVLDFDWSIVENPPKSFNRRMLDLGK